MRLLPKNSHVGTAPYAFLLYLWFLFIQPVLQPSAFNWAITFVALAAFLPIYFRSFWVEGPEAVAMCAGMALIGFLALPYNSGANAFLIFAAAGLAYAVPPRRALAGIALIVAGLAVETWWFDLRFWAWLPGLIGSVAVGASNIHFAERFRHELRIQRAEEQIEQMATVAERERIARDLHDLLGHTLSVIVMKSELASKLADRDPARAIQEIRDVERVSREALTEVRRAVEGYRARGLAGEMRNAAAALGSAGVGFEADCAPLMLPPRLETVLALALREAITNVVRHARASVCRVSLRADVGQIVFTVQDNGRGGTPCEGNGLNGMRARIAEAGGTLAVDGSDGMRLTIALPLTAATACPPTREAQRQVLA